MRIDQAYVSQSVNDFDWFKRLNVKPYYDSSKPCLFIGVYYDEDIEKISGIYHSWRNVDGKYEDVKGFCKAATFEEVEKNGFVLTPGRFVGSDYIEEDNEVFEEKMKRLTSDLSEQFKESKI